MKTLRGSISESAKAEAPPKNPLLGHAPPEGLCSVPSRHPTNSTIPKTPHFKNHLFYGTIKR